MANVPATNFDAELRPRFTSCGSIRELRTSGKLTLNWVVDGSNILDNNGSRRSITTYLFRVIGNFNQKIEPSSWDLMSNTSSVKWTFVTSVPASASGDTYNFVYTDNLSSAVSASVLKDIKNCKRAIYYKVAVYIDKMSAGTLPLFVYVSGNGKKITARATKNIVFKNKFYKDREIVWTYDGSNAGGGVFKRVFVDTSTVDFFGSQPTTKPPIVWFTGDNGFVGCLNYYTGELLWKRSDETLGAVYAGSVDPLNSVFWWADTNNNGKMYLRYAHFNGKNRVDTARAVFGDGKNWFKPSSDNWSPDRADLQTPGMSCTVHTVQNEGTFSYVNLIFATELIRKWKIIRRGGSLEAKEDGSIGRNRFGVVDGTKGGQPNVLGIVNGPLKMEGNALVDTLWTNGHVPQRHIKYTDFKVDSRKIEHMMFTNNAKCFTEFSQYNNHHPGVFAKPMDGRPWPSEYFDHTKWMFNQMNTILGHAQYNSIGDLYNEIGSDLNKWYDEAHRTGYDWTEVDAGIAYKDTSSTGYSANVLRKAMNPPLGDFNDKEQRSRLKQIYDEGNTGWHCAAGNGAAHGFPNSPWDSRMINGNTSGKGTYENLNRYVRTKIFRVLNQITEMDKETPLSIEQIKAKLNALRSILVSSKTEWYRNRGAGVGLNLLRKEIDKAISMGDKDDCLIKIEEMKHLAKSGTVVEFARGLDHEIRALHQNFEAVNINTFIYRKVTTCILQDVGMVYGAGHSNNSAGTGPNEADSAESKSYREYIRGNLSTGSGATYNFVPYVDPAGVSISSTSQIGNMIENRLGKAREKYQLFTNPMNANQRWGWLGVTVMADNITCSTDIKGLTPNTPVSRMDSFRTYFTWGDSAKSDRLVPRVLYKHTGNSGKNINSRGEFVTPTDQPDTDVYPRPSQFGITTSIMNGGFLRHVGSGSYIVYQADSVERSIHKLVYNTGSGKFTRVSTSLKGNTDLTLPITINGFGNVADCDSGSRHVITDDANSLWSISTKYVDRYYPKGLKSRKYSKNEEYYLQISDDKDDDIKKRIKNELATYEVTEDTRGFKGLLGKHFGNLPAVEYYLLRSGVSKTSVSLKDAIDYWYDHISVKDSNWKYVFDVQDSMAKQYGGDDDDTYYMTNTGYDNNDPMIKDEQNHSVSSKKRKRYIDANEYNDDNLGIAPIKARGGMEAIDIGRPHIAYPYGHIKIIEAEEVDKTLDCDNQKFGLTANKPSVFGRAGSFSYDNKTYNYNNKPAIKTGGGIVYDSYKTDVQKSTTVTDPYNNWEYHLTAHGYDDLETVERMVFQDLVGWGILGFTFMASGNFVGDPDPKVTLTVSDKAAGFGSEGIWFMKKVNNTLVNAVQGTGEGNGDYYYDAGSNTFVVNDDNVWCEVIKKVRPDILWTEPNVRGGLTEVGAATAPNYDPIKRGMNGYKIMKGRIDLDISPVYDLYNIQNFNSVNAEETNFFYIYERYPYPEFCFMGYDDGGNTTQDGFWGICKD